MQVKDAWPNLFRQARFLSAVDFVQADRLRRKVALEMARIFREVDLLIVPSLRDEQLTITNFTGHPSLTLRAGFVEVSEARSDWAPDPANPLPKFNPPRRVPHGITILGRLFDDGLIGQVGVALETGVRRGGRKAGGVLALAEAHIRGIVMRPLTNAVNLSCCSKEPFMKIVAGGLGALLLAVLMNGRTLNAAQSCEGLASLTLPDTTITLAQTVAAGAFTPPGAAGAATPAPGAGQAYKGLLAVLSRGRDPQAHQRFRYQGGSLAAGRAAGTASSRRSATEAGPESSAIPPWPTPSAQGMRARPPTPDMWEAAGPSRSIIPKS